MNPLLLALLGHAGIILVSTLVVVFMILLGKSRFWIPFVLDHAVIADGDLDAEEAAFLEKRGQELASLGFRPAVTYRLNNMARPLIGRVWLDPSRTIVCSTYEMRTSPQWRARYLSMASYGADETDVTTTNLPGVHVFDDVPGKKTREILEASTAEALLTAHRATVAEAGLVPVPQDELALLDRAKRQHRSYYEFQERRGLVRRDEERARWVGTLRAHLRTVLGQLLPSAADLEPSKVVRAAVLGAVIPAAIVLWSYGRGGVWILLAHGAIFASGFVASVFFTARAWPWALILGALPLLLGRWLGWAPVLALFFGALVGNVVTLRRRGLTARGPGATRRIVLRTVIIWTILIVVFFSFYSFFSSQRADRSNNQGTTTHGPVR